MNFLNHYSSSSGNLYSVTAENGKRLLIDPGVPWAWLEKAIKYNLSGIVGCLISHEHKDHSKSADDLIINGIPIYGSFGTLIAIEESLPLARHVNGIRAYVKVKIGETFEILPFPVFHDAAEPLGFIVHEVDTDEDLLFAVDTSLIKARFDLPFTIIALSCNYDKEMVKTRVDQGEINEEVAKRLWSSHMEWRNTLSYLTDLCNLTKCREIHLLHMSGHNIDKNAVRKNIEDTTFVKTLIYKVGFGQGAGADTTVRQPRPTFDK